GLHHAVTFRLQNQADGAPDVLLVVDDEDRQGRRRIGEGGFRHGGSLRALYHARHVLGCAAMRRAGLMLLAAVALAACEKEKGPADAASLTYTEDARAAYLEAMDGFRAKNWEEARSKMSEVRRLFGYSHYARLAELRL